MSEIEAAAKLDVNQVLQGLRQMTTELNNATSAMKRLNDQGDKSKRSLKDNLKDSAGVAGRAGGPAGSFTSKLLAGSSMDGVFGRMAASVSLATLAFRAFQMSVDASLDRVRLMIEAQRSLREVTDQTDKALEAKARRGESQMVGRLSVVAAGGQEAAQQVDNITATGLVTQDDASKGVASIYGRFGNTDRARNATQLAATGAAAGLNFSEVASQLTKMGAAVDDSSQVERIIGRLIQKQTGRTGDPAEIYRSAVGNVYNDPYLRQNQKNNQQRSGIAAGERDAFLTAGLGSTDAANAADPGARLQLEAFSKLTQTMEDLKKQAEAQGAVNGFLANIFRPEGSFETQLRRIANASADARGLPTTDSAPAPAAIPNYMLLGGTMPGMNPYGR